MVKKKIVVDTNILISALGWNGSPKEVFERVLDGKFELIISGKQIGRIKIVTARQFLELEE